MALPTKGRVIIDTTAGELDIELWSKETPKTCRNFIALAMEGYYDGVIFHRVVPNFLVQTGDKTGTGGGGESFYGEPFEDEIHPRLRYAHRGLVGMANNGTKNSNDSQFFVTLDRTDELHGKHTLFGRCVGDTVFNALKIGSMEIDENERPLYPPKIKSIRIIDNPFEDIVPRITAAEKRAQQRAREQAQREREEESRRRGAKKNTKLLSFQDEGAEEEEVVATFKKKSISRPDLVDNSEQLSISLKPELLAPPPEKKAPPTDKQTSDKKEKPAKATTESSVTGIREQYAREKAAAENERLAQIEKLERDIKKINAKRSGEVDSDEEKKRKKAKQKSALDEEFAKYEKSRGLKGKRDGKGRKTRDEGDVLAKMDAFRGKLRSTLFDDDVDEEGGHEEPEAGAAEEGAAEEGARGEEGGLEVDDDTGFLAHKLHFPKDNNEEVAKAERDYEVIDPRQRGARAREEERQRKKQMRPKDGGRGARR